MLNFLIWLWIYQFLLGVSIWASIFWNYINRYIHLIFLCNLVDWNFYQYVGNFFLISRNMFCLKDYLFGFKLCRHLILNVCLIYFLHPFLLQSFLICFTNLKVCPLLDLRNIFWFILTYLDDPLFTFLWWPIYLYIFLP